MYKVIRLLRLFKILKLVKSNKRLVHHFSEKMRISNGTERLIFFSFFYIVFIHLSACMFVFLADLEDEISETRWIDKCLDFGTDYRDLELFICSCYFIMTTTATVGYGDISPVTTIERIFGMALMFCGVLSFTFVSGTLASILSAFDTSQAIFSERVIQLNRLRQHYPVSESLIKNIRQALNFDANKTDDFLGDLSKDLPAGIKMELMMVVYQTQFAQFPFFSNLGNRYFVTWVSSMLKPRITTA